MAKVKIGDRVRFLNDVGEGVVRNVLRSGVAYVEDESGFEIPIMENELVVVTEGATIVPKPQSNKSIKETLGKANPAPKAAPVSQQMRVRSSDSLGEKLNIHLCYLVEEDGTMGRDDFEVYLVNESNYDLMVLYTSGRDSMQEVRFSGVIPFDSSEMLEHFSPKELAEREKSSIQLIAFKDKGDVFRPKEAMTINFKVDGARFFKQNAFVENPFFEDPALIIELVKDDHPLHQKKIDPDKIKEKMLTQKIKGDMKRKETKQHQKEHKGPLVIDLHIHELVDTTVGLEPKHMLEIQLDKVKEVMEQHQHPKHKGDEIVFIHGKGEGVLRKAVIDLIRHQFPKSDIQDASFQEFGFGATRVTIK